MASITVKVGSSVGLHARPASIISEKAGELDADVTLAVPGGDPVDADSALLIMTLGASHGDEVVVVVRRRRSGPNHRRPRRSRPRRLTPNRAVRADVEPAVWDVPKLPARVGSNCRFAVSGWEDGEGFGDRAVLVVEGQELPARREHGDAPDAGRSTSSARPLRTANSCSAGTVKVVKLAAAACIERLDGLLFGLERGQLVEWMRDVDAVGPDPRTPQRSQMAADPEVGADVASQRPDVGAGRALDGHIDVDELGGAPDRHAPRTARP